MIKQTTDNPRPVDIGLAILRLAIGLIFAAHGAQKLFVFGFDGVAGAFAGMNVPFPAVTGAMTALVEFFGGLALVAGLLTRLAGFGLSVTMLGAIALVHSTAGFFGPQGFEFPLALLGSAAALAFTGPGRFSLDALISSGKLRRGRSANADIRTLRKAA
jgi:putative oxidoreductase